MISVCIITRDEADMLRKCLKALEKYDVEIVITDTGSKDDSKRVALEYTDKVYDFEWCDDFSAARNYLLLIRMRLLKASMLRKKR